MPHAEILHRAPVPDAFYRDVSPRFDKSYKDVEKTFRERSLLQEMGYLQGYWKEEGLPSKWVDLPGVGFMVDSQIGFLDSEKFGIGVSEEQKKERWANLTAFSLQGWTREYLRNALVFPGELTLKQTGTQWSLIDSKHGAEMDLEDTLSPQERGGAPWYAYNVIAKSFLAEAPDGSIAFVTSPAGPSGLFDGEGKEIVYVDSHSDALFKQGDKVFEWTMRTDFSIAEHTELITRLARYAGQKDPGLTKDSSIKEIVKSVVCFDSSKSPMALKLLVAAMEQTRCDVSGKNTAYEDRLWDEVYRDIGLKDELWHDDVTSGRYIEEFRQFARYENDREKLKTALSTTVIRLSKHVLGQKDVINNSRFSASTSSYMNPFDYHGKYGDIFDKMQQLAGCAGGGRDQADENSETEDGKKTLCCTCPYCGEEVEAVIANGKISCPSCNKSAEWKEEPVVSIQRQKPRTLRSEILLAA